MELVLVRHAQPAWDDRAQAQVDPRLTELGEQQAQRLADALTGERFDAVLVSTARRARRTAAPLLGSVEAADAAERAWLHEIHLPPAWQDAPSIEVGRVLEQARARPREAWWDGMPGGESFHDFHARVSVGLTAELAERGLHRDDDQLWRVDEPDRRLLVVAHAGTNSVILGTLLGVEPEPWEWERFNAAHASVTVLRAIPIAGEHVFRLESFSDVRHLEGLPVTR